MTESEETLLSYIHNILYDNDKWGEIMTTDNTRTELKKLLDQYHLFNIHQMPLIILNTKPE